MASLRARWVRTLLSSMSKVPWTAKRPFPAPESASPDSADEHRHIIEERRGRMERLAKLSPPVHGTRVEAVDAGGVRAEWVGGPGVEPDPAARQGMDALPAGFSAADNFYIDYFL